MTLDLSIILIITWISVTAAASAIGVAEIYTAGIFATLIYAITYSANKNINMPLPFLLVYFVLWISSAVGTIIIKDPDIMVAPVIGTIFLGWISYINRN